METNMFRTKICWLLMLGGSIASASDRDQERLEQLQCWAHSALAGTKELKLYNDFLEQTPRKYKRWPAERIEHRIKLTSHNKPLPIAKSAYKDAVNYVIGWEKELQDNLDPYYEVTNLHNLNYYLELPKEDQPSFLRWEIYKNKSLAQKIAQIADNEADQEKAAQYYYFAGYIYSCATATQYMKLEKVHQTLTQREASERESFISSARANFLATYEIYENLSSQNELSLLNMTFHAATLKNLATLAKAPQEQIEYLEHLYTLAQELVKDHSWVLNAPRLGTGLGAYNNLVTELGYYYWVSINTHETYALNPQLILESIYVHKEFAKVQSEAPKDANERKLWEDQLHQQFKAQWKQEYAPQ
jgi:hypothetical protein